MDRRLLFTYTKHLSTYFSASIIPMLLSLVTNPLIALNMEPRDYAIVGYYTSFNNLVGPIIMFYMVQYYIRNYFNFDQEQRYHLKALVFKSLITFSAFLTLICYIGISLYIHIFNSDIEYPVFPYLLLAIVVTPLTGVYTLQTADYRMERNTKAFFRVSVSFGVTSVLLTLLFVVLIKWGAFGKLLAPLLANLVFFVWIVYKNKDLLKVRINKTDFFELIKFCWPLALGATLGYFLGGFDKTYLESLKDTTTYGIYNVGAQMAAYIGIFASSISTTFQPDVYEAIMKDWKKRLVRVYALQLLMILGVVLVYVAICPFVIKILTAGRYVEATPFTRIICFSTLASAIYYNINGYTIGKGFPKVYTITSVIGSVLVMIAMPIMVKRFGFYGAAYMTSVSFIIMAIVNIIVLWVVRKFNLMKPIK